MATNFDLAGLSVTFLGVPLEGFFEGGDVVSIEPVGDDAKRKTGADGMTVWAESGEKNVYEIKIKLMQGSASNAYLSAVREANPGPGPLLILDTRGTSEFIGTAARIIKAPKSDFGSDVSEREWTFHATGVYIVGSN